TYKCIYCGKESSNIICPKCLEERDIERIKREILYKIDGVLPLNIFRKFLLIAIARNMPSIIDEYFSSRNVFPEIEGRIKVHASRREILGSFEIRNGEIVDIIRVDGVEKITYKSRSKLSMLKWRSLYKDKGEITGIATVWTLKNLMSAGANLNLLTIKPLTFKMH
ncbi:MAG: hypothetical protein DRJ21_02245, partial [Candidatus Methanomethylicota archaeon]